MTEAQLTTTFAALANPMRRAILGRLAQGEATVRELAEPLPISMQAVSQHLKVLERSGLIERLDRALAETPPKRVVILASGVIQGRPRPQLAAAAARGATVIGREADPWALIKRAARVYSTGGEIGFLALLAGVPVSTCAGAFYTGWGATDDAPGVATRPFHRTVDEIFAGACLVATRYRDPFRDAPATFEEIVAILADWRRAEETNRSIAVCVGMSFWKRRRIAGPSPRCVWSDWASKGKARTTKRCESRPHIIACLPANPVH